MGWLEALMAKLGILTEGDLVTRMQASVHRHFRFLVEEYGCTQEYGVHEVCGPAGQAHEFAYCNGVAGVVIAWDHWDGLSFDLVPAADSVLPRGLGGLVDTHFLGFPLDNLLWLREQSSTIPYEEMRRTRSSVDAIERAISRYADALRRVGDDVLTGAQSIEELRQRWQKLGRQQAGGERNEG